MKLRGSLQRQLPIAAFLLFSALAASITFAAYRGMRATTRALYEERLTRLGDQLAVSMGTTVDRLRTSVVDVSGHAAIVSALVDPTSRNVDSAAVILRSAMTGAPSAGAGVWDLAGDLIVERTAGELDSLPPPLVSDVVVTPAVAANDSTIYYSVVAPIRDGRTLIGFIEARQRLGGTGAAAISTMEAILGESGRVLVGSPGGAWTDLVGAVDQPPPEIFSNSSAVSYERVGEQRLGLGRTIASSPIVLVAEVNEGVVFASTRAFVRGFGAAAAALVLMTTGAAWLLGHRITGPLGRLRAAADGLRAHDYGQRAPETGHAEIVAVARAFNEMASETQDHVSAMGVSEQRFRTLVTATAQIVWWTDANGDVSDPIPSWQSYTGRSFEETRGAGWTNALHPDDAGAALKVWREAVHSRSLFEIESRIQRHDGEYRWFLVRAVPILGADGDIREWVSTCTDITRRRDTDERLRSKDLELQRSQRLDAVGRLAGGIAHDFNNLLAAIIIPAEFASKQLPAGHPALIDLKDIQDAAKRASELTRQLLTFGSQRVMEPVVLDVNEVVNAGGRLLERIIGESVRLELAPKAAYPTIRADRSQLEQIIVNLAVNSRDAMPKGGRLTIETSNVRVDARMAEEHEELKPGSYVLLAVTDTGSGMDSETQKRMFEPFFSTKGHERGTGLGLSTVYGIVRQWNGHILVYSEVGRGTSIKVFLPQVAASVRPEASAEEGPPAPSGTETVLLAEDEAVIRKVGERILKSLGYTVLSAASGKAALELGEKHLGEIHLLVSDVVMPEMNGLELWEHLRLERPALPALFLSGWASDAVVGHGILDGQVPFLGKPFTSHQLGQKVREVLDQTAAARGRR